MQNGDDRTMRSAKGGWPMSAAGLVVSEEVPDETVRVIKMSCASKKRYGTKHETFCPTPEFAVLGKRGRGCLRGQGARDFVFDDD